MSVTNYTVKVRTGDKKGAGMNAYAYMIIHGENGTSTEKLTLNHIYKVNFKRNKKDTFRFVSKTFVGKIKYIEIWRVPGYGISWFVDSLTIKCSVSEETYIFPILRWIESRRVHKIACFDTSLPQTDIFKTERAIELEEKKKNYEIISPGPGLPAQIKDLPSDEMFSFLTLLNVRIRQLFMASDAVWRVLLRGDVFKSLDEFDYVFTTTFRVPYGMQRWKSDFFFGWQRTNSLSHSLISLCTEIPEKFGVTDEMVASQMEGLTLQQAIDSKRLFIIDLEIMKDIPTKTKDTVIPSPIALFFVNKDKNLMPIAIQLFQQASPQNPVFLPTDPAYTWIIAKMWYNLADATYHQSLTHLGFTHLTMEGICVVMHRNLSLSHPLFKLLAPHCLYLLAINTVAREELVNDGGVLDNVMAAGFRGALHLVKKAFPDWRLDVHGTLPEELKRRGVDDPAVLPHFYYRDDGLLLYDVIKKYVTDYVHLYYDDQQKILCDWELQNFGEELVKHCSDSGLKEVGNGGKFETVEHIVSLFTSVIYIGSVSHAAANFSQYDEYAFPPNYPLLLKGSPPNTKDPLSESDVVAALPSKSVIFELMRIVKILSEKSTQSLGDFEVQYIYDPLAVPIVYRFREDLQKVSETVKERNRDRIHKYEWLDPENIPNSISI